MKFDALEAEVDQTSGEFRFQIQVESEEAYAGAEFGVICSEGTEINSISCEKGTATGPREADGLVWFGFFDGEDSFTEVTALTVEGICRPKEDSAVMIQDARIYTVGDQEYQSTALESEEIVFLTEAPETVKLSDEKSADYGIGAIVLFIGLAAAAGALIYRNDQRKHTREERKNDFKKGEK
ncbi:MAG: hypothetical protein ACI4DV_01020 [Lachnospiraceae bacterium]